MGTPAMFLPLLALSAISSIAQVSSANKAADAQTDAANASIAEQQRQFDMIRKSLAPYMAGGQAAFGQQGDLLGLNGAEAQAAAIRAIEQGPQFGAMVQQGENAMLQSASATGGLRGGNTQAALAQFRPQVLSQLIGQQFANLGGISSMGMNAAAGQGQAGQNMANSNAAAYSQIGLANGGAAMATGNAIGGFASGIGSYLGQFGMPPVMGASPDQAAQDAYYNYWGKSF